MLGGFYKARALGLAALAGLSVLSATLTPARADIGPYLVIDAATGAVLEEHEATRQWYPASLTKMMTAYVTLRAIRDGRLSLQSPVIQSANSLAQPPSKMGFKVGTQLSLETALRILMVKSANDIAVAVAETVGGTEANFIAMMNAEARRMGMRDTNFVNPHGLPDNRQISSAADLALLAMALKRDFPEAHSFYRHPGLKFGKQTLRSANREFLQRVPGADGLKTGYICNSGYNVAASATRNGRTVIAIVLGAGSGLERTAFSRQVIDRGFRTRGSSTTVTMLPRAGTPPPADGYCKRNRKPGPDEILARFDMASPQKSRSAVMALSNLDDSKPIMPGMPQQSGSEPGEDGEDVPASKGKGKVDWAMILDRTVGVEQIAYAPATVSVGVAKGQAPAAPVAPNAPAAPALAEVAGSARPAVRLPVSKPLDLRPSSLVPGAVAEPAPGAIFRALNPPVKPAPRP
ncbi:D-alanyl-D-alanine carboxypeptidase family protein [Pannonibacter sp.]|uniref:D-alanyl-D-alanine carboxypeptidase family protein n=1 Tax=Pannonibacter sp. TaxID=1906786 RepID=UPI003F6F90D9